MDRYVAEHNIDHYRKLVAKETNATKCATLRRLLAEEEIKLETAIKGEAAKK